jgi:hypothetical protein
MMVAVEPECCSFRPRRELVRYFQDWRNRLAGTSPGIGPGHICLPYSSEAIIVSSLRDYRVLGVLANDIVIWFWIGSHDNYERLIRDAIKTLSVSG